MGCIFLFFACLIILDCVLNIVRVHYEDPGFCYTLLMSFIAEGRWLSFILIFVLAGSYLDWTKPHLGSTSILDPLFSPSSTSQPSCRTSLFFFFFFCLSTVPLGNCFYILAGVHSFLWENWCSRTLLGHTRSGTKSPLFKERLKCQLLLPINSLANLRDA